MKKVFSIIALAFLGTPLFSLNTEVAFQGVKQSSSLEALQLIDKPVFMFKTTAKDPYYMIYRPGSNVLDVVMFGYYPGKGRHVYRVNKSNDISKLMPIRQTTLFIDGPVKIDVKFPGYRESYIARASEEVFKTIGFLPEHYFKGVPFVDQYLENMPSKWVFSNVEHFAAFRSYVQPLFEASELLSKNLPKPLLVLEVESAAKQLSSDDYVFLNRYFTLCDLTNPDVKAFFANCQEPINKAIAQIKDAKQVKEGFADACFRHFESLIKEGKAKDIGAAVVGGVLTAITMKLADRYLGKITTAAEEKINKHVVHPVASYDHPFRNGLIYGGGAIALGLVATGVASQVMD